MTWPAKAWVASLYCRQNSMMFTPCCPSAVPTGGAGVACPALISSLTTAAIFLRLRVAGTVCTSCGPSGPVRPPGPVGRSVASLCPSRSGLGDLVEGQLDRGLPVEDVDEHLQLRLLNVDLGDGPREVGERSGDDTDHVALLP